MKIKTALLAALLVPVLASAQAYDPATGQRFDAYGRPLASVEELCREGQMAGGPITYQCAVPDYRFNRQGERLVRYDFEKWGYNIKDMAVTEHDAQRMDIDPAFRAKFIKSHGYDQYKIADAHAYDPDLPPDLQTPEGKKLNGHGTAASYKAGRGLILLYDLPCKGHPGYIARLDPDEGDVLYGCSESFLPKAPFEITWSDGGQGAFAAKEFVPTDLGVKYLAKANATK